MPAGQHRDALLNQALAEMEGPLAQNQIATLALQIDSLQSQKSAELSKAGERWNQMTAQQQHAKAEEAKRLNATLDSTLDRWSKGVEMLRPKDAGTDGAAEHNARAERIKAQARNLYNGKVPETEAAKASIWAAMGPEFVSELKAANKKIAEQAKQIADLKAAGPSLDGGDGADANGNENESFGAAVDRRLRAAGLHR
jgi:DNA-binding helix-hairpin-helix protein with protein kinase domain